MDENLNILELIKSNKFDYDTIWNNVYKVLYPNKELDLNIIIPVRGRKEFLNPLLHYFIEAEKNIEKKISITVVEESNKKEHEEICEKFKVNYIWIHSNKIFNKCLAHNIGALFSSPSKYLLFHDLDCIVQKDFFTKVFQNIEKQQLKAIQCFNKRRVLYCNENLTKLLINFNLNIDTINIDNKDIKIYTHAQAPGGSIMLERNLFFEIGGYDPELFNGYSPEDSFFWEKISTLDKIGICDNPIVEIFHLNHPPTCFRNDSEMKLMLKIDNIFKKLKIENKKEILNFKFNLIKKYE